MKVNFTYMFKIGPKLQQMYSVNFHIEKEKQNMFFKSPQFIPCKLFSSFYGRTKGNLTSGKLALSH